MKDNALPNDPIVNRIANSGLITLDLEDFLPSKEVAFFDIKPYLFQGLILKEKDFRTALKEVNWADYQDKYMCIGCSTDAIIPKWAFMLITIYLTNIAHYTYYGTIENLYTEIFNKRIEKIDINEYQNKRVIIKGCGDSRVPTSAYVAITQKLLPVVKSFMYGEACSNVPLYKSKS